MIEQVEDETLDLNFVQVGEESADAVNKKCDCEFFVICKLMLYTVLVNVEIYLSYYLIFSNLKKLLEDLTLEFKTTHMAVVGHDCQEISNDTHIKLLIKDGCYVWICYYQFI
jgi:hypothetical protein